MTGGPPDDHAAPDHVVADQGEALAFLARPETYGRDVAAVERIDTHGAIVFLAGARAYKMKRAVRYPYMDFSTLARREAACRREVELNRRTAPDLYLGVERLVRARDGSLALGGAGRAIEWLVVMRRFDQDQLCDRLARAGKLTEGLVAALAEVVVAFHDAAERLHGPRAVGGGGEGLRAVLEENAEELRAAPEVFPAAAVADYTSAAARALGRCAALLDRRRDEGYVRRCHGDLHLRNVCVIDGRPTLFDAIEFNDAIACIDVLYDLAFLLMDLEHRALRGYANLVLNRYLRGAENLAGLAALPLFLSARAAVRAKVGVSAAQTQTERARIGELHDEARAYFDAARDYLSPAPARLLAVGGLSGSGKTTLARALAPELGAAPGAVHLRSDVLRKRLAGVEELTRLGPAAYDARSSERVYAELLRLARIALAAGRTVIVDAVYAKPVERAAVEALAREFGVAFDGLWLDCPEATGIARLEARRGDASDATAAVVRAQNRYDIGALNWHRIDAAGELGATHAAAQRALAR